MLMIQVKTHNSALLRVVDSAKILDCVCNSLSYIGRRSSVDY